MDRLRETLETLKTLRQGLYDKGYAVRAVDDAISNIEGQLDVATLHEEGWEPEEFHLLGQ